MTLANDGSNTASMESEDASPVAFHLPFESSPEDAADAIVAEHTTTCEAFLRVARLVYVYCNHFQSMDEIVRFARQLEKRRFLSTIDGAAPLRPNGKLSMWKKIGMHADVLASPSVIGFLSPEYSKLYQLATLFELCVCDVDRFVVELERLGSNFTRDDVIVRIKEIKSESSSAASPAGGDEAEDEHQSAQGNDQTGPDLVVSDPSAADLRILRTDPVNPDEFDHQLPRPTLAEHAALIVHTKLKDLSIIETRLLPHLGFSRVSHLLVVGASESVDLLEQQVVLVATRGDASCAIPVSAIAPDISVLDAALTLFADAGTKFQLFGAHTRRPGWDIINWSEA